MLAKTVPSFGKKIENSKKMQVMGPYYMYLLL